MYLCAAPQRHQVYMKIGWQNRHRQLFVELHDHCLRQFLSWNVRQCGNALCRISGRMRDDNVGNVVFIEKSCQALARHNHLRQIVFPWDWDEPEETAATGSAVSRTESGPRRHDRFVMVIDRTDEERLSDDDVCLFRNIPGNGQQIGHDGPPLPAFSYTPFLCCVRTRST